jgi:thiol-disulfide isomerase/thioredoxin
MNETLLPKSITFLLCSLLLFGFTDPLLNSGSLPEKKTAEEVLAAVHEKLESLESLQYDYQLELNYATENYSSTLSGTAYLDFTTPDSVLGFRYQFEEEGTTLVYNGTESFVLNKAEKRMRINTRPALDDFTGLTPFYNSPITLRKALPAILADPTIEKRISETSMAGKGYYLIRLVLNRRTIERLGGFSELSTDRKITYGITIDKSTHLPLEILQKNSVNHDFMKSTFHNFTTRPAAPQELSWYYSSYTNAYTLTQKKVLQPLPLYTAAPDWELPLFGSRERVTLSGLKGKVVLLEFWNKNCGYCISAVPKLNALAQKYAQKDVRVLGINVHDKAQDIEAFYQRNKPGYNTLYQGSRVAEAYGIGHYPTVVLLDKAGKVIYLGGLDVQEIEKLLQLALK